MIAEWVRRTHGIEPSSLLFHAAYDRRHLATPDGLRVARDGTPELCEIKTTSRPWRGIPRGYLRQVWWQQYVLGAERTLVVWEQHEDFVPVADEPRCRWVDRDDDQIAILVRLAEELIAALQARRSGAGRLPPGCARVTTVLLHGLGADRRQPLGIFEPVVQAVAGPDELIVAPDVRAHGGFLAVGEPADFSIDRLAAEVCEQVPAALAEAGRGGQRHPSP